MYAALPMAGAVPAIKNAVAPALKSESGQQFPYAGGNCFASLAISSLEHDACFAPSRTSGCSGVKVAARRRSGSSSSQARTAPSRLVTSGRSSLPRSTFSSAALIRQSIAGAGVAPLPAGWVIAVSSSSAFEPPGSIGARQRCINFHSVTHGTGFGRQRLRYL